MFKNYANSQYGFTDRWSRYRAARDSKELVQRLKLLKELDFHNGCVNTICWNETGEYILSGSDDIHLCISNAHTLKKRTLIKSAHRNNIFSAKFLPCCNDRKIISCSGDGIIAFTNLDTPFMADTNTFNCHLGTTYELSIVPNDPFSFLSCGEDKTVRLFDLRTKTGCSRHDCSEDILINCHKAVTAMCVNPALPYQLAVGCSDSTIRIYDRRMIGTPASGYSTSEYTKGLLTCSSVSFAENRKHRITSLCYNKTGDELLVSYSAENIYLFKLKDERFITYNTVEQEISSPDQSQPSSASAPPPIKKLRVRGDWSDTGPSARPESEIETIPEDPQINRPFRSAVIDRMSDVLNRMLNDPARSLNQNTSQELDSQETVENREATNVNNSDEQASSAPCQPSTSSHIQISQPTTDVQSSSDSDKVARNDVENQCQPEELLEESSQSQDVQCCDSETNDEVPNSALKEPSTLQLEQVDPESLGINDVEDSSKESLQVIESDFKSMRQNFIDKNKMDPVVDLHYSAKSVSSGVITMGVVDTLDRQKVESSEENDNLGLNDELYDTASASTSGSSKTCDKIIDSEIFDSTATTSDISKPSTSKDSFDPLDKNQPNKRTISEGSEKDSVESPTYQPNSSRSRLSDSSDPVESAVPMDTDSENNDAVSSDDEVEELSEAVLTEVHTRIINCTRETPEPEKSRTNLEQEMSVKMSTLPQYEAYKCYEGHRNSRTMIKEANFWGDKYVISGSDCGHVFFWDKETTEVVMTFEADKHVVNCVQPHPFDPILATSGIDYDVKLWAPISPEAHFDSKKANEIIRRNKVMLNETQDTITVPASLMIRMLASLNHLRTARTISGWRNRLRSRRNERQEENDE